MPVPLRLGIPSAETHGGSLRLPSEGRHELATTYRKLTTKLVPQATPAGLRIAGAETEAEGEETRDIMEISL